MLSQSRLFSLHTLYTLRNLCKCRNLACSLLLLAPSQLSTLGVRLVDLMIGSNNNVLIIYQSLSSLTSCFSLNREDIIILISSPTLGSSTAITPLY